MILKVLLYAYIPEEVICLMSRLPLPATFSERLLAHILRSLLDLFDATV